MTQPDDRRNPDGDGKPDPWWMKLVEPFRSEGAAFRLVLWVLAICAVVALLALIIRAL